MAVRILVLGLALAIPLSAAADVTPQPGGASDAPAEHPEPLPPIPPPPLPPPPLPPPPLPPPPPPPPAGSPWSVAVGGYLQPQWRVRQNDDAAQSDENGMRVRRARITVAAEAHAEGVDLSAHLELDTTPETSLLDGYLRAAGELIEGGRWRVDAGQMKALISRQNLLSDSRIGFVEKAELSSLAPDRQIGVSASVQLPWVPFVTMSGGVFNGEGRNQSQNVDENYLFAGRLEVRPLGREAPFAESAFGGDYLAVAGSAGRNRLDSGDGVEEMIYLGADLSFAFKGLSGTFEYLQVDHEYGEGSVLPDFRANGWTGQAAYLLPLPGRWRDRIEIGGRVQEIDRNDTIPIVRPGDSNQSLRFMTGVVNGYLDGHDLKLQIEASHIVEVEDRFGENGDATYDNDTILVQATYRLK